MNLPTRIRRRSLRRSAAHLLGAAALVAVSGCAATTYDETLATPDTVAIATTTTLPSGSAADLLPLLAEEAASLSGVMIAEGDARSIVFRTSALWDAVRQEVARERPELLGDFDANVGRLETAVQFRRAADADKAATNLDALVTAFLA